MMMMILSLKEILYEKLHFNIMNNLLKIVVISLYMIKASI